MQSHLKVHAVESKAAVTAVMCQLSPKLGDKVTNIAAAKELCQQYSKNNQIDIVIFSEMAFTGYCFEDANQVLPLAVKYGDGPEFQFVKELALRLDCYVAFGYIEVFEGKLYNSAALVDRKGALFHNYRKTHLYYDDYLWAQSGNGFTCFNLHLRDGTPLKSTMMICMDINSKDFNSGQFQFAEAALSMNVQLIIFCTNWTTQDATEVGNPKALKQTYAYWVFYRLMPLIQGTKHQMLFLVANRVGFDYSYHSKKEAHFIGGSCAMSLNPIYLLQNSSATKPESILISQQLTVKAPIKLQSKQ